MLNVVLPVLIVSGFVSALLLVLVSITVRAYSHRPSSTSNRRDWILWDHISLAFTLGRLIRQNRADYLVAGPSDREHGSHWRSSQSFSII